MLTDSFLREISELTPEHIPGSVYNQARLCFLDYLGVTLSGLRQYKGQINDYLVSFSGENEGVNPIGISQFCSVQNAALVNGINAHAIELDDGHRVGMLHLGAPVISALLAVAEKEHLSSHRFLYGVIIGYEVAIRLACSVQPDCKLRGYHATGTCGTIGAAMGVAAALGFDSYQMKSTLSASITSAAGVLEMIEGDTHLKPFNAGRAAMDGITAAYIGKARFKAPEDALGGKRGFLAIMTDNPGFEYLTNWDRGCYMIERIYMKPYAACRHCHPSIEASMVIRRMTGFSVSEIESIHVDTYKLAVYGHEHTDIKGVNSAKMSIPYSVAVSLLTGRAGMDEFGEDYINNMEIRALAQKVSVSDCDELTALCPQRRVAIVTVKSTGGVFVYRVDYPKGEPENPLSKEELEDKFMGLAMYAGLSEIICKEIITKVFENNMDLSRIIQLSCIQ